LAAWLGSCDAGQLGVEQVQLPIEVVDHPQGQVNRLASDHGRVDAG
jgi:hypothetical protein